MIDHKDLLQLSFNYDGVSVTFFDAYEEYTIFKIARTNYLCVYLTVWGQQLKNFQFLANQAQVAINAKDINEAYQQRMNTEEIIKSDGTIKTVTIALDLK